MIMKGNSVTKKKNHAEEVFVQSTRPAVITGQAQMLTQ